MNSYTAIIIRKERGDSRKDFFLLFEIVRVVAEDIHGAKLDLSIKNPYCSIIIFDEKSFDMLNKIDKLLKFSVEE